MIDEGLREIPGYDTVANHFGRWPSFHDAIVEQLSLNIPGETRLTLRTWNMTSEVDERGFYRLTHRAIVKMLLTDILEFDIGGADIESGCVLFGLSLVKEGSDFKLLLDPALGFGGSIRCRGLRLEVYPEEAVTL